MLLTVQREIPADGPAIERLLDGAFGKDRYSKTCYRYRETVRPLAPLCHVALQDGTLVGSIRYWPVMLEERGLEERGLEQGARPALLLGPLAVDGARRALGIGKRLVDESLKAAAEQGYRLVFLVGDPVYYRRFGFIPAPERFVMPGETPGRLMMRVLRDGTLQGGTLPGGTLCRLSGSGLGGSGLGGGIQSR